MKRQKIVSVDHAIELALTGRNYQEIPCDLKIEVNRETWQSYALTIGYREISFYCDRGRASAVVDSYGDRNTWEIVDWECD